MVGGAESPVWPAHFQPATAQTVKCLRTRHLMTVMSVDIQLGGPVRNVSDSMGIPYFVEKCLSHLANR